MATTNLNIRTEKAVKEHTVKFKTGTEIEIKK